MKKILNKNYLSLLYLIIVGEMVFALPFHVSATSGKHKPAPSGRVGGACGAATEDEGVL